MENITPPAASAPADNTSKASETKAQPGGDSKQSNAQGGEHAKPASISDAGDQALKKIYKVKVDGQEQEVDEDRLLKDYELRSASHKRMQEAAKKEKQAQAREDRLKRETDKVLKEMGIDPLDFAEQYIAKVIQEERLTPEQREIKAKEDRIRQLEANERERQTKAEQEELAQMAQQAEAELATQFMKSFEKAGLEMDAYGVKRMAEKYYLALEDGIENPDIDLLCELVQEDLERDLQKTIKRLPMDKRLKYLGDEVLKEIREADLARLKNPPSATNRSTGPVVAKTEKSEGAGNTPKQFMTSYEFREWLEQQKQK